MKWLKCDFHVHTTESDGKLSPEEVLRLYRDAGYHAIAITDHDILTRPKEIPGIIWIPGEEFTVYWSWFPPTIYHVLCLFIDKEVRKVEDLNWVPLSYHAHPYTTRPDKMPLGKFYDGFEALNGAWGYNVFLWGKTMHFRIIGNSDGHGLPEAPYATAGTWVYAEESLEGIFDGLKNNRCVVFVRERYATLNLQLAKDFEKEFKIEVHLLWDYLPEVIFAPYYIPKYMRQELERYTEWLKRVKK